MPSGHWFNGRGFATLNCASDKTYNGKLKHQMPFNQHRNITLVWSNMGVVCKECHSDEHIKADCPVYRERTVKRCHKCQSMKHLKADCPEMPWNLFNDIRAQAIKKDIAVDNDIYVSLAGLLCNVDNSIDRRHMRIQMNRLFEASNSQDGKIIDIFSSLVTKLPNFERLSPVG